MSHVNVRLPDELKDRVDSHRPATVSREAWVREACHEKLEREGSPALEAALGATTGKGRDGNDPQSSPVATPVEAGSLPPVPASPRTPRPARDVATPEPIATVDMGDVPEEPIVFHDVPAPKRRPSKQELDMQRQQKLNAKKGATKR